VLAYGWPGHEGIDDTQGYTDIPQGREVPLKWWSDQEPPRTGAGHRPLGPLRGFGRYQEDVLSAPTYNRNRYPYTHEKAAKRIADRTHIVGAVTTAQDGPAPD